MAIKLHRCPFMFLKFEGHACHRVQKALDEQNIPYEVVKAPLAKSKRERVLEISGQATVPTIEFEDGTAYRQESKDMAAKIRAGGLGSTGAPAAAG